MTKQISTDTENKYLLVPVCLIGITLPTFGSQINCQSNSELTYQFLDEISFHA